MTTHEGPVSIEETGPFRFGQKADQCGGVLTDQVYAKPRSVPVWLPAGNVSHVGGAQAASSHSVVTDEADGVPVLYQRILARDPLIDGDQHLLFA